VETIDGQKHSNQSTVQKLHIKPKTGQMNNKITLQKILEYARKKLKKDTHKKYISV
jgi:hypothetical protein